MIAWLTSKTGVFAAVVAVIGLAAALFAILRPTVENWRKRVKGRPSVAITKPDFGRLSASSRSRELRFYLVNRGGGRCVVQAIRLAVDQHGESETPRQTVTEAPLVVHQHRVELQPDQTDYDIRSRAFGPALPPIALDAGETEAFVVKLVAHEPHWYDVRIAVEWFDTASPDAAYAASTGVTRLDFPPTVDEARRRPAPG